MPFLFPFLLLFASPKVSSLEGNCIQISFFLYFQRRRVEIRAKGRKEGGEKFCPSSLDFRLKLKRLLLLLLLLSFRSEKSGKEGKKIKGLSLSLSLRNSNFYSSWFFSALCLRYLILLFFFFLFRILLFPLLYLSLSLFLH